MKIDIDMGTAPAGAPALIDLEELLATRLLVQGNSGSGKSHLLRRLLEQSAPWVQQCIVDPEGDFVTLADRFGHLVVDANRPLEELEVIAARVRQHRVSTVLNLEGLEIEGQMRAAASFLNALFDAERDHWYPMLVVVDEAQMFAPVAAGEFSDDARRASLGAMTNLMCRGRKRGLAGVIATQRLAKLAKNVAAEASNFLMGRTFLDIDMARAADLLGMERRQAEMFRDLKRGHFVALGPALSRRPVPYVIGGVETSARSSSPKLMPLPETPADARDLILKDAAMEAARPVRRAARPAPPPPAEGILEQLARAADQRAAAAVDHLDIAIQADVADCVRRVHVGKALTVEIENRRAERIDCGWPCVFLDLQERVGTIVRVVLWIEDGMGGEARVDLPVQGVFELSLGQALSGHGQGGCNRFGDEIVTGGNFLWLWEQGADASRTALTSVRHGGSKSCRGPDDHTRKGDDQECTKQSTRLPHGFHSLSYLADRGVQDCTVPLARWVYNIKYNAAASPEQIA